ncbi:DUF1840 domain-containing protein [Denitromonas ohlonensis]|uniref:DUF1840 domain-containing protein n=2 Tax=Denitromonas TaxID=139331 RepID=A0A557SBJ5_9RHOO|nr:DUF1840 domain-containing protein [Denitromonas ohlonensis]TVO68393.1 DUF1840 domain-containing protein [Denitromonas ohlonensis]TVO74671.1 DUF1840 domain-containing protein [Denitromonas ohlonensis]
MLTIFKSPAGADVIMLGPTAQAMFRALGRDPDSPSGIVTVEQLPDAIARLKQAIAADRAAQAKDDPDAEEAAPRGMAAPVSFYQRAWPLLELLELAQKEQKPVTWGV